MSAPTKATLDQILIGSSATSPVLNWPSTNESGNLNVVSDFHQLESAAKPCLFEVQNPFGESKIQGIDLNQSFEDSPEIGAAKLAELTETVQQKISMAKDSGANGILYVLHGANEMHCSPMQYGGLFLENDRAILQQALEWGFVFLFIAGGTGTYLDIVSDLPCNVMGWSIEETSHPLSEMKLMRSGATCTSDSNSEWNWKPNCSEAEAILRLERMLIHA